MKTAQQQAPAPETDLSLNEMLRVMDVAREMRKDRETAERVLSTADARTELRNKLMRSAQLSGDRVTEAEVEAAIDTYFADRHRYEEPAFSPSVFLAHCWVRRGVIIKAAATGLIIIGSIWGLFFASFAPLSPTNRAERAAATVNAEATQLVEQIRAASLEPSAVAEAERLAGEIAAAGSNDPTTAIAATDQLRALHQSLLASYTLRIARDADGSNLISRNIREGQQDKLSGYYVLVEAVDSNGSVIEQKIRNAESGKDQTAKIWAERIPADVYEQLKQDKQSDGVMNTTQFAVKERGRRELEMQLKTSGGSPIERSIQITNW